MGNNYGKLACNARKENICFCSRVISGFSSSNAHIDFEMIDRAFYNRSDSVGSVPLFGITLDTGKHAKFHVLISVCGSAFFGCAAGTIALAVPLPFPATHLGASPFDAVSPTFFRALSFRGL